MASKFFVAASGGADSTATALLLWERGVDFEMCFADTGAELPEVYWLLPRLAAHVGKPLHVVSGGGVFQYLTAHGFMLPGPRLRWCTRVLKQAPQDRFYQDMGAEEVAVGIRADEPRRLHTNEKPRYGGQKFIYPLAEAGMDKAAVKELCTKYDLLNPIYEWRTNTSCFCCFFQRLGDWRGLWRHHPTLFAIAEEWERHAMAIPGGSGWRYSDKWTLEKIRLREQHQGKLDLWPDVQETDEEPCLICTV